MTAQAIDPRHPVARVVARVRDELRDVAAQTPVWSMGPGEAGAALTEVTRLVAQAEQLQLRLLAHCERKDPTAATDWKGAWARACVRWSRRAWLSAVR